MGTRRRSAPSPDGPRWAGSAAALGTLLVGLAAVGALILPQIGSGSSPSSPGPVSGSSATAGSSSVAPSASADPLLVGSVDGLSQAVALIEATGTFSDPLFESLATSSLGTGFVVDPTGVVLTNSHVVNGASTVNVRLGPGGSEYGAGVLGVSECSDLAVLRLDTRDRLPFLAWSEAAIVPPLDVHAAGHPLGDPEYTLKRGIVSQAPRPFDVPWASVGQSIEHDANIADGWSGGPVVTNDGRLVAINYAWNDVTGQSVALSRDDVLELLPDLLARRDVTSVGINGYAQEGFDAGPDVSEPSGIWVVSVRPDSPAATAGILAGDLVTHLDGRPVAVDGTMADYCSVLRVHEAADPLSFSLYRDHSGETLDGTLNGTLNGSVTPGFAFEVAVGGATPVARSAAENDTIYTTDDTLSVEAPPTWSKYKDFDWVFLGTKAGPGLIVSTDVEAFDAGFETAGALIRVSASLGETPEAVLAAARPRYDKICEAPERGSFSRGQYAGVYDVWEACAGATLQFLTIAARNSDGSHVVYIQFQSAGPDDLAILDRMLVTLEFDPAGT